jgi:tripartite-type tricarboxylate transporter receptor subunit TctC
VVENRPGASSTIGLDIAAKAAPRRLHTVERQHYVRRQPEPDEEDALRYGKKILLPVSLVSIVTLVMTVHPSVPARSVKALIALAKSKPDSLNYGSAGNCERESSRDRAVQLHGRHKDGPCAV